MSAIPGLIAKFWYLLEDLDSELSGQTSSIAQHSPLAINAPDIIKSARQKLEAQLKTIIISDPTDTLIQELEFLS